MAAITLADLRIDEATWSTGSLERRREWRLAIDEILQEGAFELDAAPRGPLCGSLSLTRGAIVLEVRSDGGERVARHELARARIAELAGEYMKTIVEMSKLGVSAHSPRLEALDIAKRLTHDEAGEELVAQLTVLRTDHATARRIFTLIVTLLHDTTRLHAARAHTFHY